MNKIYKITLLLSILFFLFLIIKCDYDIIEEEEQSLITTSTRINNGDRNSYKSYPTWSPDGQKIVYCNSKRCTQLLSIVDYNPPTPFFMFDDIVLDKFSISPDGKQIVYRSLYDFKLYIYSTISNTKKMLVPDHQSAHAPAWSPDGKYIAFCTTKDSSSYNNIWIVPVNDGNAQKITKNDGNYGNPSWSPNSSELVFSGRKENCKGLFVADVENGNMRQLQTDDSTRIRGQPSFSPDGSQIAFQKSDEIRIVPIQGGEEQTILSGFGSINSPVWSSDGESIYFFSNNAIYKVYPENGITALVVENDLLQYNDWALHENSLIISEETFRSHIQVYDFINSAFQDLTQFNISKNDYFPDWLDSEHVLFIRDKNIWKISTDDRSLQLLVSDSTFNKYNPEVSPDGLYIAYDNGYDICRYNISNNESINLTPHIGERLIAPTWSADGKQLACCTSYAIKIFNVEADRLIEHTVISGEYKNPAWSKNVNRYGNHIAVEIVTKIYLISLTDWKPQLAIPSGSQPSWSPKGNQIAYSRGGAIYIVTVFQTVE